MTRTHTRTHVRRVGIPPSHARDQLQKAFPPTAGIQPLPAGAPGRRTGAQVGIKDSPTISFCIIGDHGGIKDPSPQNAVAAAIAAENAGFVYSVGDVVYFNGDATEYAPQFYEPYAHVLCPIVAIPGNHDGDTTDDPSRPPLDTFIANFCSSTPAAPPADPQDEYGRDTQTQPYCDWTLNLDTVTIIGLYSNVPSGGHLEASQTSWLQSELAAAPTDRSLIVALHHPPYSIDAHHGGSAKMGAALDAAFQAAQRCPQMVLSGHVHDTQRFTRSYWGKQIAYVVVGNSGYHNLHALSPGATVGQPIDGADPDVTYQYGDASEWGYLKATASKTGISFEYVGVAADGTLTRNKDTFTISV